MNRHALLFLLFAGIALVGCDVGQGCQSPTQVITFPQGTPTPSPSPTPSPTPCQLLPAGASCGDNLACCSRICTGEVCQ